MVAVPAADGGGAGSGEFSQRYCAGPNLASLPGP